MSKLAALVAAGQSIWIDELSRDLINSGELATRVAGQFVTGVTSNPTIFAGAIIGGSKHYQRQLAAEAKAGAPLADIYSSLITRDIQQACDVLGETWEASGHRDGLVSVEVSPELAHDTDATVVEVREWAKRVDRPNLLVKVPATAAGVPAIEQLTSEGISVNVTLIFSLERYQQVMDAYLAGLRKLVDLGGDSSSVNSVASFFVSRFDTETDPRLEAIGTPEALALRGKTAVANARAAFGLFQRTFDGEAWDSLKRVGAAVQRPLWASTSTKNPAYRDTLYVDTLVAAQTVNTMPRSTLDAYEDHGPEPEPFGADDIAGASTTLEALAEAGIDYDDVTETLEREGVQKFADSFHELLAALDRGRRNQVGD